MLKIVLVATVVAFFLTICEVGAEKFRPGHCGAGQDDAATTRSCAGAIG